MNPVSRHCAFRSLEGTGWMSSHVVLPGAYCIFLRLLPWLNWKAGSLKHCIWIRMCSLLCAYWSEWICAPSHKVNIYFCLAFSSNPGTFGKDTGKAVLDLTSFLVFILLLENERCIREESWESRIKMSKYNNVYCRIIRWWLKYDPWSL